MIEHAIKESKNPHFKSSYAGLPEVIDACKKALNDNGLIVTQVVTSLEFEYLETYLIHAESGEFIGSKMRLLGAEKGMQQFGSAITYARRYMLQSLVFLSAEDDDGELTKKPAYQAPVVQDKLTPQIFSELRRLTNNFENKEELSRILNDLNIKNSKEIYELDEHQKFEVLSLLKGN